MDWIQETFLKAILPRAVAALVALGIAHTDTLHKWGLTVDWTTLGGKATNALAIVIGLVAAHHAEQAITGGQK